MKTKVVGLAIALMLGLGLIGTAAASQTGYEGQPGNQSSATNNNNGNGQNGYEGKPGNQGGN